MNQTSGLPLGKLKNFLITIGVFAICDIPPTWAGYFELSANGSYFIYNNGESVDSLGANLGVQATTKSRRLGGSFGYHFLKNASLEFSYVNSVSEDVFAIRPEQDIYTITRSTDIENMSVDLVLDFNDKQDRFRPFLRGGIGYMIRETTIGATDLATSQPITAYNSSTSTESVSGNAGVGFKYFVAQSVGIDITYSIYITDLDKDQIFLHHSVAGGLRFLF